MVDEHNQAYPRDLSPDAPDKINELPPLLAPRRESPEDASGDSMGEIVGEADGLDTTAGIDSAPGGEPGRPSLVEPPGAEPAGNAASEPRSAETQIVRQIKVSCHGCEAKLDVTDFEPFSRIQCPICNESIIVPKWFDNYLLEEPGGIGGMATVYRALDMGLDREVAIKVLNPELAKEADHSAMFLNEARTAATINHHAVIPVYTCGDYEGLPYIVMQYMGGGSLEEKVKSHGALPVRDVCRWIRDICEGLDSARRHGIVHHDIKPGNIMLDVEGNAKIGDFGIAQALRDNRSADVFKFTKAWISPHYVSPEKVKNGREDFLGDIYSLGATFYHLTTGSPPFSREDSNQLVKARLSEDPTPPIERRGDIPKDVSDLIMGMMSRDPDNRPKYQDIVNSINGAVRRNTVRKTTVKSKRRLFTPSMPIDGGSFRRYGGGSTQKRTIGGWLRQAMFCVLVFNGGYFLYRGGAIEEFRSRFIGEPAFHDLLEEAEPRLADISRAFATGDVGRAANLASTLADDGAAPIEARSRAAVQAALAAFLRGAADAPRQSLALADMLRGAGVDDTDSHVATLYFLAYGQIPQDAIEHRLKSEPRFRVLGKLAAFVRNVSEEKPFEDVENAFADYMVASGDMPEGFWGNAWVERLPAWETCVAHGDSGTGRMEPLLEAYSARVAKARQAMQTAPRFQSLARATAAEPDETLGFDNLFTAAKPEPPPAAATAVATPTTAAPAAVPEPPAAPPVAIKSIAEMSLEEFLATREPFAAKPDFDGISYDQNTVRQYLRSLPSQDLQKQELLRFNMVSGLKEYLVHMFARGSYEGAIRLKRRSLNGTVSLVNTNMIIVNVRGRRKNEKVSWDDLHPQQIVEFLKHFAGVRSKAIGPTMSRDEAAEHAARDFLRAAVFCDWHKQYNDAYNLARQGVNTSRRIEAETNKLLLGSE